MKKHKITEISFYITNVCNLFSRGKLYKCPLVTVGPDFIKQLLVDINEQQRALIENYEPAGPDWDDQRLSKFINNINNEEPIPQCSLFPEKYEYKEIRASTKKITFHR